MIGVLILLLSIFGFNRLLMFFFKGRTSSKKEAYNKSMPVTIGLLCGGFCFIVANGWSYDIPLYWVFLWTAIGFFGGWYNTKHYYLKGK
jgi:hypothetical protein